MDQLEEAVPSQPTAFTPVTGMAPALSDATSNLPATPLKASTATMGTSNGRVELHVDALAYPADGISVIPVRVRLFDAKGNKLAGRVPVTLEASLGRWLVGDVERAAEGAQVTVTDGEATFMLAAPSQPGRGEVRVTSPLAQAAVPLLFTPSQRALMVAGLVHGRVEFGTFSGGAAVTSAPTDGFEDRLSNWAFASDSGRARGGVRAAVFAKGTVMGDRLLTLGFDSERNRQDPQFRDISPDEMYPTYGDASQREFDAQSTQRLYARLDHGATYTRLGDFATQRGGEGRVFSAWERSLTGVQHHGESARGTFNVYAAQGTITQVRDEIPGRGMSGPYFLSRANAVINSERVEIVTRDRNQPALILVTKAMTRFADYTIEPYSGRLLFRAPVPSLDANFNPVSIRIVYEVDQGGGEFYTYGADAQVKLGDRYEVGGVVAQDLNPLDSLRLVGANISARFGERTLAIAELAHSEGVGNIVGNAGRIEFRHQDGKFETRLFGARAGASFGNRSSTFIAGRQELGGRASYALSADTRLLAEVIETQDTRTNGKRTGALLSIEHAFGTLLRAELGYRWAREDGAASALTATLPTPPRLSALRARVTLKPPGSDRTSIFAELEQDMQLSDARRGAIGGEWLLSTRARLYARHEWTNGYAGPYALTPQQSQQNTVVGIDADYMQNAQVFSEYRARDAFSGRDAEASIGLRNRWSLAPGLLVNTSAERVAPLAGAGQGTATALTGAIEWTRPATSKVTGRLEWRNAAKEGDGWLMSAGLAQKLTRDWTLLARTQWDKQGAIADRNRSHLGVAWRETDRNQWNGLLRYERRHERTTATGAPEVSSDVDIMAGLLNWQPTDRLVLSGRLAAKVGRENREGTASESQAQLLMGRATYDLTRSWDVGLISSLLVADGGSARRYGAGAEIGRLVATNLRLAVGYNLFGYREKDLDAFGYTSRGAYVEFAFKFDETLFGRGKTAAGSPK